MTGPLPSADQIITGTPKWVAGEILFENASHPKIKAAQEAAHAAIAKLAEKVKTTAGFKEIDFKLVPLPGALDLPGSVDRLLNDKKAAEIYLKHAPDEFRAFQSALSIKAKAEVELKKEQFKLVQALTELEGAAPEQLKAAQAAWKSEYRMMDRIANPNFLKTNFAVLRELGPGAAWENTFNWKKIKADPSRFAVKGFGAVVGLGAIVDATFRGKKTDPEGNELDRSWVVRTGEGVIGAALAAGSVLQGRR